MAYSFHFIGAFSQCPPSFFSSLSLAESSHMEDGMASLSWGRQPSSQRNQQLGPNKVEKHISVC